MTRYRLATDLDSWQHNARIRDRGFTHPWVSKVDDGNGEDAFLQRLDELMAPDHSVVDVGCGHGELSISLAKRSHRVVAIDRDESYIELAHELAAEAGVDNIEFINLDFDGIDQSSTLPLDKSCVDLVNRRGPIVAISTERLPPFASGCRHCSRWQSLALARSSSIQPVGRLHRRGQLSCRSRCGHRHSAMTRLSPGSFPRSTTPVSPTAAWSGSMSPSPSVSPAISTTGWRRKTPRPLKKLRPRSRESSMRAGEKECLFGMNGSSPSLSFQENEGLWKPWFGL